MACQFCHTNGTTDFLQFLKQSGHCNLVIEAQWVVVVLVGAGFLLLLVLIAGILIGYGCHFCYEQRKSQRRYHLSVLTRKG